MLKVKIFTTLLAIFFAGITCVLADGNDLDVEEFISKHKARVEKAGIDDWETFAECANALVTKRIASEEVILWIDKSIEIKETIYNRTVKGDYLVCKGKIKEAQNEYIRAIELARELNKNDEIPGIQWKILISMGVENYNNFHSINQ